MTIRDSTIWRTVTFLSAGLFTAFLTYLAWKDLGPHHHDPLWACVGSLVFIAVWAGACPFALAWGISEDIKRRSRMTGDPIIWDSRPKPKLPKAVARISDPSRTD